MRLNIIPKILIVLMVFSSGVSFAQLKDNSILWTLNLGLGKVKNITLDENIPIRSFNTTIEHLVPRSDISIGFNLGWSSTGEVLTLSSTTKTWETYSTTMFLLTGKYHFNRSSEWVPYVGLGAGFHSTTIEYAISGAPAVEDLDTIFGSRSRGSFALAGTVGINVFSSQTIFAGVNFTPIWLEDSYYKDNWLWIANLSLGFQFN